MFQLADDQTQSACANYLLRFFEFDSNSVFKLDNLKFTVFSPPEGRSNSNLTGSLRKPSIISQANHKTEIPKTGVICSFIC